MLPLHPEYSKKHKDLLVLYKADAKEFYRQLAVWTTDDEDVWDGFRRRPSPTPPDDVKTYATLKEMGGKLPPIILKEPHVIQYFEDRLRIESENRRNLEWLQDCLSYLPQDDTKRREKITNRIFDYKEEE